MDLFEKLKRLAVTLLGMGLIAGNKKLGLDFSSSDIMGIASLVVGYVSSGAWKATVVAKADLDAKSAAATITNLTGAVDAMKSLGVDVRGGQ